MSTSKRMATAMGGALAPRLVGLAPGATAAVVREALHRGIHGVGPLPGAAEAAEAQLSEQKGDVNAAVRELIENHVAYAGAGGFVTNLGGVVTTAFLLPANIAGLALIQSRMVAGIAHLRGYDLDDPRTRNAVLETLLGRDRVDRSVKAKRLPAPPMALATAPAHDPEIDRIVAAAVATELIGRVAGKRLATTMGRKIPIVGGVVGAGADGLATFHVGRYARAELLPRPHR
jgi:uncharacterized protein (DUF697 family)